MKRLAWAALATRWRGKHLRAFLTEIEEHGDGVWHYNLHIQSPDGKVDYHNYHISFGGRSCDDWTWVMFDSGIEASVDAYRYPKASTWAPIDESSAWLAAAEAININGDLALQNRADAGLVFRLERPLVTALAGTAEKADINVMIPYPNW